MGVVRLLLYKRGYCYASRARLPLADNNLVEKALGKHGLICIEDIVHEIATVGPKFTQANRFLAPFALRPPAGGFRSIKRHYVEG